jgi:hypothetical protein
MSGFVSARRPIALGWVKRRRAGEVRALNPDRSAPELVTGERILIRDALVDGGECQASAHALHVRPASSAWRRIGWEEVAAVGWSRPDQSLRLQLWYGEGAAQVVLPLPARSRLADFAAERVVAGQLAVRRVSLGAGRDAIICAVRAPGADCVTWKVRYGPGCDPDDPAISAAADLAVSSLRAQFGC